MSESQVSNTRRVVFTAMALVVFWVVACQFYWLGYETAYSTDGQLGRLLDLTNDQGRPQRTWAYYWVAPCVLCIAGSLALVPTALRTILAV